VFELLIYLLRLSNSTMCLRYIMLTGRKLSALLFTFCTCIWVIH